jgi:serine/threonine protein kinase
MMFPPEVETRPKLRGFEVLERLGAGGVGSVYLARSKSGRLVAIKILSDPNTQLDHEQKQSFSREASLCARLGHPCIVQVRAFVQDAGYVALVFEYVQGVALARLLRFTSSRGERLPDAAALTIVERVLSALAHAHGHKDESGLLVPIVHRDVSPSNVLVDWEGNVKLTDFGMAKMLGTSTGTRTGLVQGTFGCMARALATRIGCSSQQGPHHVAQKLRTTGFPLNWARSMVRPVPTSRSAKDGAGLPMSGDWIAAGSLPRPMKRTPMRAAAMITPTRRTVRFMARRSPLSRRSERYPAPRGG